MSNPSDALVINDTSFAGDFAPYFILPALGSMDTVNKGLLYIKDGIKKQHTIGRLDFDNPFQSRVADPVAGNGDITIDGRTLVPNDFMLFQPFNPRDLEIHWESVNLPDTLLNSELPKTIETYTTYMVTGRAFERLESCVWMGSTTYTAAPGSSGNGQIVWFDGFLKQMLADSNVYKTASPVVLTSSNIGLKFQDLLQAAATNNKALLTNPSKYQRLKFECSINTQLIYEEYLTTQPYKNNDTTQAGINRFKGFEIVPVFGMPDDTIVFTEALSATDGNLWLGMNSVADENFQLARVTTFSERFAIKMLMKMGVNYGFANKVFLYTTLTSSTFTA